ncbi:unnamed protein product, partial [Brassica oleracea var. botrytis]
LFTNHDTLERQMKTHSKILVTITLTINLVCLARAAKPPCNSSFETADIVRSSQKGPLLIIPIGFIKKKKKDQPDCGRALRGHSYTRTYLPQPGNHYTRGCSKIYRCRRDSN